MDNNLTHEEVFGHLDRMTFTFDEVVDYIGEHHSDILWNLDRDAVYNMETIKKLKRRVYGSN